MSIFARYWRILFIFLCFIGLLQFVTYYFLTKTSETYEVASQTFHSRSTLQKDTNLEYRIDQLSMHINELENVKLSLKNELRELEGKRHILLRHIQEHTNNIESIQFKAANLKEEVSRRQQELEDLRFEKTIVNNCPQLPFLKPAKDFLSVLSKSSKLYPGASLEEQVQCTLSSCLNFQQCSFGKDFHVYVYKPKLTMKETLSVEIYHLFKKMAFTVLSNSMVACVYVVLIDESFLSSKDVELFLHSLEFWQGDGHNHFIFNFGVSKLLKGVDTGRAMIGQIDFDITKPYRRNYDIVVPSVLNTIKFGEAWQNSARQLPAHRKYILSFEGQYQFFQTDKYKDSYISIHDLKQLPLEMKDAFIRLSCKIDDQYKALKSGWGLCETQESRAKVLKVSTFALIHQPENVDQTFTIIRFTEALQYGAVPVLIGQNIVLPFEEVIEWRRAAVILHSAQFSQINYILHTLLVNDLLDMRWQGRFLWETYLSTKKNVLASTMAVIQTRLSLSSTPVSDIHYPVIFKEGQEPTFYKTEKSFRKNALRSPTFYRNFTTSNIYAIKRWNSYPGSLLSYPSSPFVPILPSSAAFLNSSIGMQPIGKGEGGAGIEFQKALGGDHPYEEFTIVMLTYEREMVLVEALTRLTGLQYLHKVIVVWNSPREPAALLKWPNIGVPVKVLRAQRNSLNNRFLPFDEIETDAVLSVDDDVHLRQDEILFGFRVWREARDRIVGFPGRFHAWDMKKAEWYYNSHHSCELSMVLTGGAFIHKYYMYLYTYVLPQAIRDKVDEFTNCEDIAMNFLVSHVTRKPPVKVTSRWTFRCPGCPNALYQDDAHFNERHRCINFFVEVFGYMPLLRTQFRADSVLFKTRIPQDKSKCFTYI